MLHYFIPVKDIIILLTPLIAMEVYLRHIYHVGIIKVAIWWFKNHSTLEYGAPLLIGFFFTYFAFFATFDHFLQNGSLAFNGENHRMLYIGDTHKNASLFVPADNLKDELIISSSFTDDFNYQFSSLFTETLFKREKGGDRLWTTAKSFSFVKLLLTSVLLLAFILPLMGILHMYAYPVTIYLEVDDFELATSTMNAFNDLLAGWNLSLGKAVSINAALFVGAMVLASMLPSEKLGKQVLALPDSIKPGMIIEGQPVRIVPDIRKSSKSGRLTANIDTGFRTIVFKFKDDFVIPVHVSVYYNSKSEPELEDFVNGHIKNRTPLKLEVLHDLRIKII